ncbi:MAG: hypothetical protein O2807_04855 [bacterium]|nr:hypothetical protein [bacterium]
MEALILKARLEAENSPVHLSYESTGAIYALTSTDLGQVHVQVPAAFESAARFICELHNAPQDEAGRGEAP